jgi:hypothetical protein
MMMLIEVIAVYCKNYVKENYTVEGGIWILFSVKAGGTYS